MGRAQRKKEKGGRGEEIERRRKKAKRDRQKGED